MKFIATLKTIFCCLFILSATSFSFAHHQAVHKVQQVELSKFGGGTAITVMGRSIEVTQVNQGGNLNANGPSMMVVVERGTQIVLEEFILGADATFDATAWSAGRYRITVTTATGTDIHEVRLR